MGRFSAPATPADIAQVERELGVTLPDQLRALYLESDGFREPRGNAKYLLSLLEEDSVGSLLSTTRFWWNEGPNVADGAPRFSGHVFFGMSSADEFWGIGLDPPFEVICYQHSMGDNYETLGRDIIAAYKADFEKYDLA